MKKRKPSISLRKKPTGWAITHQHHHEDNTSIEIDVAPLVAGITDCLHVFYPDLHKSFTVTMDPLKETDIERIVENRSHYPTTIEQEEILSDEQTHCYLIREEPVKQSYGGVMRYVVRSAHLQEASKSLHLIIHVQVDALFENSHIEMIGAGYPELGVEFSVMLNESGGTETQAIMDELIELMFVNGWDDGEDSISPPYGYRIADEGNEAQKE